MSNRFTNLLLSYQRPRGGRLAAVLYLIAVLLLVMTWLVYGSGGSGNTYLHIAYLPIIVAGFLLHRRGGALTGLLAGLLLGPMMPLNVAAGIDQDPFNWVLRTAVFVLAGLLIGHLAHLLAARALRLANAYAETLHSLATLVAARDEQAAGHCQRVAANAKAVGSAMGLTAAELQSLYWAGVLHDLGKVAIPDRILLKAGTLSPEEYHTVKTHCELGADLVAHAGEEFEAVAAGVRSHHERWDGTGYPDGSRGTDIPLFGRILGVVDVFEALTTERPYRKPVGLAETSELLRREAGGHFDPEVVQCFLDLLAQGAIDLAADDAVARNRSGSVDGDPEVALAGTPPPDTN